MEHPPIKEQMKRLGETRRMVRYSSIDDSIRVGDIYISKLALPVPPPTRINVTIEMKED
jgi:hypothetical protein